MSAPALRDVQARFWRALHGGEVEPALARVIVPSPTLDPPARVAIYQGMYVLRLAEVLREDFPKLAEALGDDFQDLARRYLAAHPSEYPSVREFGRHLPDFLRDDATAASRPWLSDLARLELARVNAFDAPDAVPLRAADLAAIAPEDWPGLRFTVVSSLGVVDASWRVHDVWAVPAEHPAAASTRLRVWRQDFSIFHTPMDPVEADALQALVAGASFADVCEAVAAHVAADEAAVEAGALLARWIEDGLLAALAS
jgi:hypothetical protein